MVVTPTTGLEISLEVDEALPLVPYLHHGATVIGWIWVAAGFIELSALLILIEWPERLRLELLIQSVFNSYCRHCPISTVQKCFSLCSLCPLWRGLPQSSQTYLANIQNILCEKPKHVEPLLMIAHDWDRAMMFPAQLVKSPMDFLHVPTSVSRQSQLLLTPLMVLRGTRTNSKQHDG